MSQEKNTNLNIPYIPFSYHSSIEIINSDGNSPPVFFLSNKKIYDKYYRKIVTPLDLGEIFDKKELNIFTKEEFSLFNNPNINFDFPFPRINETIKGYKEWQESLNKWYNKISSYLSSVLLPTPISGRFYLPSPPKIFNKEEKTNPARFRTFKCTLWPLLPKNYLEFVKTLISGQEFDENGLFPEQIPKREQILMKHHISCKKQWMAQLVPPEPQPLFYKTFEDYENSFLRWASITNEEIDLPPTPQDMSKIISIDNVKNIFNTSKKIIISKPNISSTTFYERLSNFSPQNEEKLSNLLYKLLHHNENKNLEEEEEEEKEFEEDNLVIYTFNFDKNAFIDDFIYNGCDLKTLQIHQPHHPNRFITFPKFDSEEVCAEVSTKDEINWELINLLLENVFQPHQIEEYMKIKTLGKFLATHLSLFFSDFNEFKLLLKRAEKSISDKIHISFFIHQILRIDSDCKFFEPFSNINNLEIFQFVVELLSLTSSTVSNIIPLVSSESDDIKIMNQFYLYSCLTRMYADLSISNFLDYIRIKCRELSYKCAELLINPNFRSTITDDLKENFLNDGTKIALMIVQSNSQHLHRLLCSNDFSNWLNLISISKNGTYFIQTLVHSDALYPLALLFLRYSWKDLLTKFDTFTPMICYFLRSVLNYLLDSIDKMNTQIRGVQILNIFNEIVLINKVHTSVLLVPIAKILSKTSLISDFHHSMFKSLLTKVIDTLIKKINIENRYIFRQQVTTLIILSKDAQVCTVLSLNYKFIESLVTKLSDKDINVLLQAWELFMMILNGTGFLNELFIKCEKNEKNDKTICIFNVKNILSSLQLIQNPISLRKFLNYCMNLINNKKWDLVKLWLQFLTQSSIDYLVKLYVDKKLLNESSEDTIRTLVQFFSLITESKNLEIKEFRDLIIKSLENNNNSIKKKTLNKGGVFLSMKNLI